MRNFSRSQYEEGSCTHTLSKKGKEKKGMLKAQYKELLATCKFKFKKVSAHTSHDHQQKDYKL